MEIKLMAERTVLDDTRIRVVFRETTVRLFGVWNVLRKETQGKGVWKYLFAGVVENEEGNKMFLRVMETPSLFVIKQDL